MATNRNIQMNYYNGTDYDVLYPQSVIAQIENLQNILDSKLNLSGGLMTGALNLSRDPKGNLEAATKQYVDNKSTSSVYTYINHGNYTGTGASSNTINFGTTTTNWLYVMFDDGRGYNYGLLCRQSPDFIDGDFTSRIKTIEWRSSSIYLSDDTDYPVMNQNGVGYYWVTF